MRKGNGSGNGNGNGVGNSGKRGNLREERLQIMLAPDELAAVDSFRFAQRMPSRAAAVRELIRLGLAADAPVARSRSRSREFGVLSTPKGDGSK
jgi:hypothetical protein